MTAPPLIIIMLAMFGSIAGTLSRPICCCLPPCRDDDEPAEEVRLFRDFDDDERDDPPDDELERLRLPPLPFLLPRLSSSEPVASRRFGTSTT